MKVWALFFALSLLTLPAADLQPVEQRALFTPAWLGGVQQSFAQGGPENGKYQKIRPAGSKADAKACSWLAFDRRNFQLWYQPFEFIFSARGKGDLEIGCREVSARDTFNPPKQNLRVSETVLQSISLTEQWKEYRITFCFHAASVGSDGCLFLQTKGPDSFFDIAGEKIIRLTPRQTISASPGHVVTFPGEKTQVTFTIPGKHSAEIFDGGREFPQPVNDTITLDTSGVAECGKADLGTAITGVGRVGIRIPASGAFAGVFVNRIPRKEWDMLNDAAKKIRLAEPVNILFLGDSLTDFDRGRNYVDKVVFWLEKYNPGKVRFLNAGVGGDTITQVAYRLAGRNGATRPWMYGELWKEERNLIFVFLGHNDTRFHYTKDGGYQQTTPAEQSRYWQEALTLLKQKSRARIILVTPASSDFERCQQAAEDSRKAGRQPVLFGEPARMEEFCRIERAMAEKYHAEVLDLYSVTKNLSEKASFFTYPDGVHLTSAGNNFVALQILRYLAKHSTDKEK